MSDPETEFDAELAFVKQTSIERLISHLNGVGAEIVNRYPMAEVQSWTIQRGEAEAVIAAGEAATLAMAPFLVMVCESHYGPAEDDAARLAQVHIKAGEVKANADLWAALAAYVNGLRARTQDAIEAAATIPATIEALQLGFSELEVWRANAGI